LSGIEMAKSVKMVLGERYRLTGEFARGASVQRAWDRWLNRQVFIKILPNANIDDCAIKTQFINSAQALARIDHPNIEALLDYGATEEGAPYHVMHEAGDDLATLTADHGRVSWARARGIVLDVIAGVDALHRQRIVHGDISPHTVALFGETARLVQFGDAELTESDPTPEQISVDVHGVAALAFALLTGFAPTGRASLALAAALERVGAPRSVRAILLRTLLEPGAVALSTLRRELAGGSRVRARTRWINAAAGLAATVMLSIGLWSSVANSQTTTLALDSDRHDRIAERVQQPSAQPPSDEPASSSTVTSSLDEVAPQETVVEFSPVTTQQRFDSGRTHIEVGSEGQRKAVKIRSEQIDLHRDLSPTVLVQRGIDLTHGRPTPEDDPRLPVVDGPLRARELFEAACALEHGKGCHMLGVQIAEGMIPNEGTSAADYYRRGCALDYHRSCAALADLARAGEISADADALDAKACALAGPESSYCGPREGDPVVACPRDDRPTN
jgi:hypothetical protein